jgi:threonine dehydrogenase-like Zn-dependent dehydrogenase
VGDLVVCGGWNIAVHAELVAVPLNFCAVLASRERLREAAFSTIAAISLQAVRLARPMLGEIIAVIGTGIIGQFAVAMARLSGARVLVVGQSNKMRLDRAKLLGAEWSVLSSEDNPVAMAQTKTQGCGVDAVIHCAKTEDTEPLDQALNMVREKGTVVLVGGMPLEMNRVPLFRKEVNLVVSRSTGPGRYDASYEREGVDYPIAYVRWTGRRNLQESARLIRSGAIDVGALVTHEFPFTRAPEAFDLVCSSGRDTLGVVLNYREGAG